MSDPKHFHYLNPETGLIETIDSITGQVVAKQSSTEDLLKMKKDRMTEVTVEDGTKMLIELGAPIEAKRGRSWPFTQVLADVICQMIAEGSSITEVCKMKGMPSYPILCRWRREHPEFQEAIKQAYADRAEMYHDKAIQAVEDENVLTQEDIAKAKLQVDTYKWAAGVGNADRFGNRTKISGDPNAPLQLLIETGIRRKGDPGYEEPHDVTFTPGDGAGLALDTPPADNKETADKGNS